MVITIALLIHVLGAIIGLGPTMTFSFLGKAAEEAGPNGGLAVMEVASKIERSLVTPVALFTQPVSGVVLIFATHRNEGFFTHYWLWISIILFIGILTLSFGISGPSLHKMIAFTKEGKAGTPEFIALGKKMKTIGPFVGIMFLTVIFLMVVKPGA